MYAKFTFYSVALMYAFRQEAPVSIMIGGDNLYWVVDRQMAGKFLDKGGVLLNSTN